MAPPYNKDEQQKMRQVLFYAFLILFIVLTILTILSLFFNVTRLKEKYESTLMGTFILEVGIAIVTLFYMLFGLKRSGNGLVADSSKIRVYISAFENGFIRGGTYIARYEIFNEETGQKTITDNVDTQWGVDGSLGFTVKHSEGDIYIKFIVKDNNGKEWFSDHFKPGNMRFQKLNQSN